MITIRESRETGVVEKYDKFGNTVYRETTSGLKIWNKYDNENRIVSIKTSTGYLTKFTYDDNGKLISRYEEGPDKVRCTLFKK